MIIIGNKLALKLHMFVYNNNNGYEQSAPI